MTQDPPTIDDIKNVPNNDSILHELYRFRLMELVADMRNTLVQIERADKLLQKRHRPNFDFFKQFGITGTTNDTHTYGITLSCLILHTLHFREFQGGKETPKDHQVVVFDTHEARLSVVYRKDKNCVIIYAHNPGWEKDGVNFYTTVYDTSLVLEKGDEGFAVVLELVRRVIKREIKQEQKDLLCFTKSLERPMNEDRHFFSFEQYFTDWNIWKD